MAASSSNPSQLGPLSARMSQSQSLALNYAVSVMFRGSHLKLSVTESLRGSQATPLLTCVCLTGGLLLVSPQGITPNLAWQESGSL